MSLPLTLSSAAPIPAANSGSQNYVGPFISSAGNVYIITTATEGGTFLAAYKATDPTSAFTEQDSAHRPDSGGTRVETVDVFQVGDVLHMGHSDTANIKYSTFSMATDTWGVVREAVAAYSGGTSSNYQAATVVRSDGSVIILSVGATETVMGTAWRRTVYARRVSGVWTTGIAVGNTGVSAHWLPMSAVLGGSDRVHFFMTDQTNADAYQRCLNSANSLETLPAAFDTAMSTNPRPAGHGISYTVSGTTKVRQPYQDSTSQASIAKLDSNTDTPTVTVDANVSDNNVAFDGFSSPASILMGCAVNGSTTYLLYASSVDRDIYYDNAADGGSWGTDVAAVASITCNYLVGVNIFTRGGNVVLAYVYKDGSTYLYNETVLASASVPVIPVVLEALSGQMVGQVWE